MDEIPDVVSARRFKEFDTQQKEELYETLLNLSEAIKDIPKKSLRRTLDVTFAVLQYKGEQVKKLERNLLQSDPDDLRQNERLLETNEKLKEMLSKLEDEKTEQKKKIEELTNELLQQQKRLQDALNAAEMSDKDSSDPLSELDKQEELLRNISRKNKHIKRLLKEIETLQTQNIEQSKSIIQLEKELQHHKALIEDLKVEISKLDGDRKDLKNEVNELSTEITRLEGNITYLEEERESSERDLKDFIERLEVKAQSWKTMLGEKERELTKLRKQLKNSEEGEGGTANVQTTTISSENDDECEKNDLTKLMNTLEIRDRQIEQLELKLKKMAEEMLTTTQLMNKLSNEREDDRNPKKPRACCKLIEQSLQAANKRCREISEMLERSEEDNSIKSKQAMQALSALESYQRGEDGLTKAIRKCSTLEQKVVARDKQIRSLVMQLNSMHEIANENSILRKRLNIPEDAVISTKNLAAKERSKEKMIDRLTLKLRASEEMRLQLKLEKTELRKQILELHKEIQINKEETLKPDLSAIATININSNSEIGEISDSAQDMNTRIAIDEEATCTHCHSKLKDLQMEKFSELTEKPMLADLQSKYQEVLEENEILRYGMIEILQKLREYDASSEHITIDSQILLRLLEAIQFSSSAPQTPNRTLPDLRLQQNSSGDLHNSDSTTETDELPSIASIRDGSISRIIDSTFELKSLTMQRPSLSPAAAAAAAVKTPKQHTQTISNDIGDIRALHQEISELSVYKQRYEDLRRQFIDLGTASASNAELIEKITNLELELANLRSSYQFMREDFDQSLTKLKQNELNHIKVVTELKSEINAKVLEISQSKQEYERSQSMRTYSAEEYETLLNSHATLQGQMAFIVEHILSGSISPELKINEICADYGIIEENLHLNFQSAEDYANWKQKVELTEQKQKELQRKTAQLEGLLGIAQDQIQSQQRLLNEITDNHIDLRHLVADLQSKTEEKHLVAKLQRELSSVNAKLASVEAENDELNRDRQNLNIDLNAERQKIVQMKIDFNKETNAKEMKIKFLLLSLHTLKEKYAKFTPLIFLTNFVFAYTCFIKKIQVFSSPDIDAILSDKLQETLEAKTKETQEIQIDESSNLIKLVKAETKCKILKESLANMNEKCETLQKELTEERIRHATESEHWQTIKILCSNQDDNTIEKHDATTNTDVPQPQQMERRQSNVTIKKRVEHIDRCVSPISSPSPSPSPGKKLFTTISNIGTQTSIENGNNAAAAGEKSVERRELKLKKNPTTEAIMQTVKTSFETQAVQTTIDAKKDACIMVELQMNDSQMDDAKDNRILLIKEELLNANKRIEDLQQQLTATKTQFKESPIQSWKDTTTTTVTTTSQECGVIEKTIMSLNALLMDKDRSLSKYQDLLQNERDQNIALASKLSTEMDNLRSTVTNLNFNIKAKDMEILELKTKMETVSVRRNSNEKLDLAAVANIDNVDNSLNELTDEKIEELFHQDATIHHDQPPPPTNQHNVVEVVEVPLNNASTEKIDEFIDHIKTLEEKLKYMETALKIKEEEITLLKEKLKLGQEREKSVDHTQNSEIEKLRSLVEEKDKQINDLMDTLKSFHEDQQNFFKDSSSYSEDQISKLSSDLMRTEATNKIYQTQIEALRRQLTNLSQREKQAREQNQSLRNQLIKRPVVSIKTELNTRVKMENMQKRIAQLETELDESRSQIQRQQVVIEAKRAKSASEVGLWEKQKRWQQNAEKLKTKLDDTEATLEKTRTLLQSAKNTIARLEKDKQILEVKLGRVNHGISSQQKVKCCRTPSCPNLNRSRSASISGKYTPSESPETYTGGSSDYSSPPQSICDGAVNGSARVTMSSMQRVGDTHHQGNLIEALKARIELQQRKILAMELEGKGTNALTCEMEKLQEKVSATEAQNIRLEAKNLQLQLDNDLMRQNDASERLQKRIKHLEDYIIALKEELAQTEANRVVCKCSSNKMSTQQGQAAEQTILSLRNLVEKLRVENKYLKEGGRRSTNETKQSSSLESMPTDVNRLQQMYAESLEKISTLQSELSTKAKCLRCSSCGKPTNEGPAVNEELKFIKEQLVKKTQLLEKAKVLLTRAAAKEKVLKEQVTLWKRKCSELQNVPVIEEISE